MLNSPEDDGQTSWRPFCLQTLGFWIELSNDVIIYLPCTAEIVTLYAFSTLVTNETKLNKKVSRQANAITEKDEATLQCPELNDIWINYSDCSEYMHTRLPAKPQNTNHADVIEHWN